MSQLERSERIRRRNEKRIIVAVDDHTILRRLYRHCFKLRSSQDAELGQYRLVAFKSYPKLMLYPLWRCCGVNFNPNTPIEEFFRVIAPHIAGAILDLQLTPVEPDPRLPEEISTMTSLDFSRHLYEAQTELRNSHLGQNGIQPIKIAPRILVTGLLEDAKSHAGLPFETCATKHQSIMPDIFDEIVRYNLEQERANS